MSKRPWMAFYVRDYLANTPLLSLEEHGAYLLLMCHYWEHGHLPASAGLLHKVCRCTTDAERGSCDTVVSQYFTLDGDVLRHERIDEELEKVVQISEKRVKAAKKSHEKRSAKAPASAPANADTLHTTHTHTHKDIKTTRQLPGEAIELAKRLGRWIRERDPDNRSIAEGKHDKTFQTWGDAIDKINRLDGREWGVIQAVIDWCQQDEFWQSNILSGVKLRKQFNQLFLKMSKEKPSQSFEQGERDYGEGF